MTSEKKLPVPRDKHFLDTSVAVHILVSSSEYKAYFETQFGARPRYINQYVHMELVRALLIPLIDFYFVLALYSNKTVDDALALWSQNFAKRRLKIVLLIVPGLMAAQQIDINREDNKESALQVLGLLIKRYWGKMRTVFVNTSEDATRCGRATVKLLAKPNDFAIGFRSFLESFDDVKACRNACRIDHFVLERKKDEVTALLNSAEDIKKTTRNKPILDILEALKKIRETSGEVCTCRHCSKIGDAVVALQVPRGMRLEHTDKAFDHISPVLGQAHKLHPSMIAVHTQIDDRLKDGDVPMNEIVE